MEKLEPLEKPAPARAYHAPGDTGRALSRVLQEEKCEQPRAGSFQQGEILSTATPVLIVGPMPMSLPENSSSRRLNTGFILRAWLEARFESSNRVAAPAICSRRSSSIVPPKPRRKSRPSRARFSSEGDTCVLARIPSARLSCTPDPSFSLTSPHDGCQCVVWVSDFRHWLSEVGDRPLAPVAGSPERCVA
jgi:hypothetical protein